LFLSSAALSITKPYFTADFKVPGLVIALPVHFARSAVPKLETPPKLAFLKKGLAPGRAELFPKI